MRKKGRKKGQTIPENLAESEVIKGENRKGEKVENSKTFKQISFYVKPTGKRRNGKI